MSHTHHTFPSHRCKTKNESKGMGSDGRLILKHCAVCIAKRNFREVNGGKSNVMIFERIERREVAGVVFDIPNRVSVPAVERCEVVLGEKMKKVRV